MNTLWQLIQKLLSPARPKTPAVQTAAPVDDSESFWLTQAREAAQNELPQMKAAATAWRDGLGTFTGILTLVGVTVGPAALKKQVLVFGERSLDIRVLGLVLLVLILYFSVQATLQAQAAVVLKLEVVGFNADSLKEKWYRDIDTIADRLRDSRKWATRTVAALIAYALLVMFAVDAKAPTPAFTQLISDTGAYCGTLITDRTSGKLTVQLVIKSPKGAKPKLTGTPPIADGYALPAPKTISSLTPVETCPAAP